MWKSPKDGQVYKGQYVSTILGRVFLLTRKTKTGRIASEIFESPNKAKDGGWKKVK